MDVRVIERERNSMSENAEKKTTTKKRHEYAMLHYTVHILNEAATK